MVRKHIVITGTGRAGTSFLVKLFGRVGIDIGLEQSKMWFCESTKCGMEYDVRKSDAPYICKDPRFCDYAEEVVNRSDIKINYVLILMRDLYSAAESRRNVSKMFKDSSYGGLWAATSDPQKQENVLLKKLYGLMLSLSNTDIPVIFINFPMLIDNSSYLYEKLRPIVGHIPFMTFKAIFDGLVRPEWVHNFTKNE